MLIMAVTKRVRGCVLIDICFVLYELQFLTLFFHQEWWPCWYFIKFLNPCCDWKILYFKHSSSISIYIFYQKIPTPRPLREFPRFSTKSDLILLFHSIWMTQPKFTVVFLALLLSLSNGKHNEVKLQYCTVSALEAILIDNKWNNEGEQRMCVPFFMFFLFVFSVGLAEGHGRFSCEY